MTDKEKVIKELKEALDSLDITNKYRLNLIRAIEYLQKEPEPHYPSFEESQGEVILYGLNGSVGTKAEPESKVGEIIDLDKLGNKCMYAKDNYTDEDRKVLCKDCEDECEYVKKEPVSEDFEEAANNALNNVLNNHEIVNVRSCLEMFKLGVEWKEKEMQSTIELAEDHAMFAGMVKGKEEMVEKASVAFQVVCNCQAKLLPNCNKFCNRCEQFKQAIKDE